MEKALVSVASLLQVSAPGTGNVELQNLLIPQHHVHPQHTKIAIIILTKGTTQ